MLKLYIVFFLLFLMKITVFAQCSCTDGASIGGMTPLSGTTNVGVLQELNLRMNLFYKNEYTNSMYKKDTPIENIDNSEMGYNYIGYKIGYGITDRLTIETGTGYFANKFQTIGDTTIHSQGLSDFSMNLNYNLIHSIAREFEITVGIGINAPLQLSSSNLPQNLMPSSGAYSYNFLFFYHKGYSDSKFRIIVYNILGINSVNEKYNYKYGDYNYTSLIFVKEVYKNISLIMNFSNELRLKDEVNDKYFDDSGGYSLELKPQINYVYKNWNFSAIYNYAIYRYLNGTQLGKGNAFSLNVNWEWDFGYEADESEVNEESY